MYALLPDLELVVLRLEDLSNTKVRDRLTQRECRDVALTRSISHATALVWIIGERLGLDQDGAGVERGVKVDFAFDLLERLADDGEAGRDLGEDGGSVADGVRHF